MNEPWGLSGPQFLEVYGAGMAAVIVIPLLARQVIRRLAGGRRQPAEAAGELDVYQAGYLAGGPRRAAQVIVAELTQAGALRVSSQGQVSLADPGLAAASPAVRVHGVRTDLIPFGDSTQAVLKALARDEGVKATGRELGAAGLVVLPARQRPVFVIAAVLIGALHAAAIARFMEAAANHRPAGDLTALFILSLVMSVILVVRLRRQPWLTPGGAACLRRLHQAGQDAISVPTAPYPAFAGDGVAEDSVAGDGSPGAGLPGSGFPGAGEAALLGVALLGFTALTDTELRGALLAGMPSPGSGGGGGGGCGGGGCGGGGCGG
jgi:uncharacterized protein (TIGR04222 family)